jgi:hypothetical protein
MPPGFRLQWQPGAHGLWAGVTFTALIAWPAGAWRRGPSVPWALRSAASAAAAATLLALLAWYLLELTASGGMTGLAERVMGTAEVSWPLTVVLSCRRPAKRGWPRSGGPVPGVQAPPSH